MMFKAIRIRNCRQREPSIRDDKKQASEEQVEKIT